MASKGKTMHVALLRGINVGGKHKLPMADLVRVFEEAGAADVRTYIQSGNVAFAASARAAKRIAEDVSVAIHERFGFAPPVVVRSAEEMARVLKSNPFAKKGVDAKSLHVGFMERTPTKAAIAGLDPERSPGDRFAIKGRGIYLHLPKGMARTKLTNAYFDSTLGVTSTFRNWRTVAKLAEVAT